MNLWYKEISNNPIEDIKKYLNEFSPVYHQSILNGKYKNLSYWTPSQLLLFYNPILQKKTIYYLLQQGIDLNIPSRKGLNFYQLFLILFFFIPEFQNKETVSLFIDTLKFGFLPNQFMILSPSKIYTILDCFYQLQKKNIIPTYFFSSQKIYSTFHYQPLSDELYNSIYISLLCYGCKFLNITSNSSLHSIHLFNYEEYVKKYPIFYDYILENYKLPKNISIHEIKKRIEFLYKYQKKIEYSPKNIPIQSEKNFFEIDKEYFNLEFIENEKLQCYEFLSEVNGKYIFHHTFFPLLYKTKLNPFTRTPISKEQLEKWKNEIYYNFPITTLEDNLLIYPYFFSSLQINKNDFYIRNLFFFIENYLSVSHPYHQTYDLVKFKPYEIQYFSHILYYETSFLKKFKKVIEKPSHLHLFKVLYYYFKSNVKYVNIIYFLMEEILQDIHSYHRLKSIIDKLDENSTIFYNEYSGRFGTYNPEYMKKFIENLIYIHRYATMKHN